MPVPFDHLEKKTFTLAQEFKAFIMRGNVIDLAVGVIIGGAFGKITSSLVTDIIMPPIGLLMGGVDFKSLFIPLNGKHYDTLELAAADKAPVLNVGSFLDTILNFLIISAAIFALIKVINMVHRKQEAAPAPPPEPTKSEVLLEEIRDLLKKKSD